jgi:hypothetical protein
MWTFIRVPKVPVTQRRVLTRDSESTRSPLLSLAHDLLEAGEFVFATVAAEICFQKVLQHFDFGRFRDANEFSKWRCLNRPNPFGDVSRC